MKVNYREDVVIDVNNLDKEWVDQAPLGLKYAKLVSVLRGKKRKIEELRKIRRSELIIEVNNHPEETCNKPRPNAADIEAYYRNHPDHKKLSEQLIAAEEELEYAELARMEISVTRKTALENLVKLHGQSYFSTPTTKKYKKDFNNVKQGIADEVKPIISVGGTI